MLKQSLCTSIYILRFAVSPLLESHSAPSNLDKCTCHLCPVASNIGITQMACWGWVRGAGLLGEKTWGCWQLATYLHVVVGTWAVSHSSPGLERKSLVHLQEKTTRVSERGHVDKMLIYFLVILLSLQQVKNRLISQVAVFELISPLF